MLRRAYNLVKQFRFGETARDALNGPLRLTNRAFQVASRATEHVRLGVPAAHPEGISGTRCRVKGIMNVVGVLVGGIAVAYALVQVRCLSRSPDRGCSFISRPIPNCSVPRLGGR